MTSRNSSWRRSGAGRGASSTRRRPAVEGLESRSLLATSVFKFPGLGASAFHQGLAGPVALATQAPTTLTLTGPAVPVTVGQTFIESAIVGVPSGSVTPPSGTVTFRVDGVAIQPASQVNMIGQATALVPPLSAGNHVVTASYSGNFLYAPSTGSTTQSVGKGVTASQLSSNTNFPTSRQSVYLSVVVNVPGSSPGLPQFSGVVTFYDQGTPIGTVPVNPSGFAQLVRTFPVGGHLITAAYAGNGNYTASTSFGVPLTVRPGQIVQGTSGTTVAGVSRFGYHWQPTTLQVFFSAPLDTASAEDANDYRIVGPDHRSIAVLSATYDPASQSVTLVPAERLNLHVTYHLTVIGGGMNGVTDAAGHPLDGAGNGQPGTDSVTTLTARNLVIPGFSAWRTSRFPRFYGLA